LIDRKAIIIPGPRKCGTTTLFQMLKKHPSVDSSVIKEPQFLALDSDTVQNNIDWYQSLFSNNKDKIMLDGSTLYFSSKRAIANIKSVFKDVKIIIMLRDPAKRAYSAFWHMKKKHPPKERRDFEELLDNIEGPELGRIIRSENRELNEAKRKGLIEPDYLGDDYLRKKHNVDFTSNFEDPLWFYKYFQGSIYSESYEAYKSEFGNDVKLVFFEEFIKKPKVIMDELVDFLGIEKNKKIETLPKANKSSIPNSKIAKLLENIKNKRTISNPIIKFINKYNLEWAPRKIQGLTYEDTKGMNEKEYNETRKILKKEYEYWIKHEENLLKLWSFKSY